MRSRAGSTGVGLLRGLLGSLLAGTLLAVGACSSGGDSGNSESGASRSPSAGSSAAGTGSGAKIAWKGCGENQCGTLQVPLDYADPSRGDLRIALIKIPAAKPRERVGSLLVNPGGPGGSGIEFAQNAGLPTEVTDRMDLIGFDPRGVGQSSPLNCHSHLQQMYDADPTLEDAATKSAYLKVSREYVDECATKEKKVLPFLGTLNVARDMDRIRIGLGEDKLNYLGYSYGTSIGQMYAQLFPTRIRTMVLDGVVDTEQSGLEAADQQAAGFETALDSYLADCEKTSCALGADPRKTVERVVALAERKPIPAPDADRSLTPGLVQLGIGQALYAKSLWPQLTQALVAAQDGDGSGLVNLADQYLGRKPDGSYGNGFDIYFAVSCLDNTWPRDPEKVFANAKAVTAKAPILGEGLVNDYVRCSLWPVRQQPLPEVTAVGSPPIVVISTTRDPATPYRSGVEVAKRLPQGRLISYDGDGHTVFGQGDACVDDAVSAYLVEKKDPRQTSPGGLRCG